MSDGTGTSIAILLAVAVQAADGARFQRASIAHSPNSVSEVVRRRLQAEESTFGPSSSLIRCGPTRSSAMAVIAG